MAKLRLFRATGWAACSILTAAAVAAILADRSDLGLAALAILVGLGVAILADLWHTARASAARAARIDAKVTKITDVHGAQLAQQRSLIRRDTGAELRHQTREVEALMQVLPRLGDHPVLPPTGDYAMDARSLGELSDVLIARQPRFVVELGSGTSSVWVARHLAQSGGRLVSIDHEVKYADATRAQLERQALHATAEVRVAPLVESGEGARWYDGSTLTDLEGIDILIVDGPPGATNRLARRPALEAFRAALNPGALVILDDAKRPDEREILDEWMARWPEFARIDAGTSTIAILEDRGAR